MIKRYRIERRRVLSHEIILHAKCASTTLRQVGTPVNAATLSLPTVAFIRDPIKRWISGYVMYLSDLASHESGVVQFRPPHYPQTDVHTSRQVFKVYHNTHLVRFEHLHLWAERCGITLPHLHSPSDRTRQIKLELIQWLKENPDWREMLIRHLQPDYQLRANCVSVQSLPSNFFTI